MELSSPEIERRWSIFILDHEESHASPRRSVSPSAEIVYTENRRYFADQEFRRPRHKPDQNMVEYWVPPEKTTAPKKSANGNGQAQTGQPRKINQVCPTSAPNGKRAMKVPKVKEPRGENSSKKSSAGEEKQGSGGPEVSAKWATQKPIVVGAHGVSPRNLFPTIISDQAPSAFRVMYWNIGKYFEKAGEAVNHQYQKIRLFRNRMKANKVAPIHTKVQSRHLELEPLCCLSSCLVRGGCTTVVVFELCYVVATALCIFEAMFRKKFVLWEPFPKTFNGWFAHQLFYYAIALYDIFLFIIAVATARALVNFDKTTLRIHYFFCFFSFVVNLAFLIFSIWSLASTGPLTFTPLNCLLIFCFLYQLPLQIWAVTVVRSCRDFFALIHVFVSLAES